MDDFSPKYFTYKTNNGIGDKIITELLPDEGLISAELKEEAGSENSVDFKQGELVARSLDGTVELLLSSDGTAIIQVSAGSSDDIANYSINADGDLIYTS